ncbi:NUDIX hydrolase [Auraticoccus monumenti]|uniref:ADP-ribose pyrophosphatase YjhB, NUDIX family n=1 Tax=Auraticoccus monumenti TaxID=675864 RepID=A0A1G6SUG6_9ACTN|nr:NUDIX domain-containing protein [Auraticoccus monumenti]SDD20341.1 ADP-ribose pyrophosphatase YjhB, NUDIX family [Auraticoccus monumenti]
MPIPDFITELRTMVGHHRLWLPGVSAVVTDDDGRVLLERRSDNGRWTIPSGILEPGEQPAEGILREITEETGVTARVEELVEVHSEEPVTYANGDVCQFLNLLYRCRHVSGEARVADDESLEVGWFRPEALPAMTAYQLERIERVLGPSGG